MIRHLSIILACQLLGEIIARALALPLPGPVLGMIVFLLLLIWRPAYAEQINSTAQGLLSHLSLLFVPAGVGVVGHIQTLGSSVGIIMLAIVVSTVASIVVSVYAFTLTSQLMGRNND
ncbi:hypothetical protein SIN8267_01266 [Sinobacterium norvegicum]|uniref:CidA/LrgA family protein n=1 Tax=Sinobacterium norvegicum TaxID=1641715 RepID=A0ABM9ADP8_9GAMM|nr:CidA/LrgA family protein [Sinobacterium norvegicum]CAH0991164.1 hypothetical protein SIN8267_01266 [Sinobacterium norvegicum]